MMHWIYFGLGLCVGLIVALASVLRRQSKEQTWEPQ